MHLHPLNPFDFTARSGAKGYLDPFGALNRALVEPKPGLNQAGKGGAR